MGVPFRVPRQSRTCFAHLPLCPRGEQPRPTFGGPRGVRLAVAACGWLGLVLRQQRTIVKCLGECHKSQTIICHNDLTSLVGSTTIPIVYYSALRRCQ